MTKPTRSDETRALILETAMRLFRERGFEATTMREIAGEAGVALGGAYYYFESKDAIVLAFYDRAQDEMEVALEEALAGSRGLKERLESLLKVKLAYFEPNRRLLSALSRHTDQENRLSPFSPDTKHIRDREIGMFERALTGSRTKVSPDLAPFLPRLLWFYEMGVILFWINDRSVGQAKTRLLLERSVPLVASLIRLSGMPLLKPVREQAVNLLESVFAEDGQ